MFDLFHCDMKSNPYFFQLRLGKLWMTFIGRKNDPEPRPAAIIVWFGQKRLV